MLGSILRGYSVHMDSTGPSVEKKLRGCRTLEDSHLLLCSEGFRGAAMLKVILRGCHVEKDTEGLQCLEAFCGTAILARF